MRQAVCQVIGFRAKALRRVTSESPQRSARSFHGEGGEQRVSHALRARKFKVSPLLRLASVGAERLERGEPPVAAVERLSPHEGRVREAVSDGACGEEKLFFMGCSG